MNHRDGVTGSPDRAPRPVHRSRPWLVRAAALVAVVVLIAGCGGGGGKSNANKSASGTGGSSGGASTPATKVVPPPSNGVITIAASAEADSLDPQYGAGGQDYQYLYPLFDTLVDLNPQTLAPEPGLATSWKFVTPTSFVMQLRQGVQFQDGTPFNAAAVVYSINRFKQLDQHDDLNFVSSESAQGDYQVTLTLSHSDFTLPQILSDRGGMIVSPTAAQKEGQKGFGLHPVGTGPYEFVSWTPTDEMIFKPFPNYWGTKNTSVKELDYKFITNPATATNGLLSGSISYAYGLDVSDVATLRKAGIHVDVAPTLAFTMIYFNMAQKPLTNKLVRQAVNYAIDRNSLIKGAQGGYGQPAWFPLPNTDPLYDAAHAPSFPYNPAKAKQLLAQAGYPHGVTITANSYASPGANQEIAILEAELGQVGINFKVTLQSVSTMITTYFTQHNFNAELSGWSGRPTPTLTYGRLFPNGSFQNAGNVPIPGFNDALLAFQQASTVADQKTAIAKLNQIVDDFAPYAPLYFEVNVTAYQSYIKGNVVDSLGKNLAIKQLTLGS
jgi:peptide/nickel transport system substrate-binding protein